MELLLVESSEQLEDTYQVDRRLKMLFWKSGSENPLTGYSDTMQSTLDVLTASPRLAMGGRPMTEKNQFADYQMISPVAYGMIDSYYRKGQVPSMRTLGNALANGAWDIPKNTIGVNTIRSYLSGLGF